MILKLYLQRKCRVEKIPKQKEFLAWSKAALDAANTRHLMANTVELAIRLVNEEESATLNKDYRHKSGPTNILSFITEQQAEEGTCYLGDLVICAPLVNREALEQNKTTQAHWAHLTVHGVLHLLGYDHEKLKDACLMETLEILVLKSLNYSNPYIAW